MVAVFESYKAGLFSPKNWLKDLLARCVVGVVALPLAMAFAIAIEAKPEQGIYTAIIAGILVSLFGGTRIQISGPTGAFILVLAGVVQSHGMSGLLLATVLAAVLFVVAWNMSEVHHVLRMIKTAPKSDVATLIVTFLLTVFADLVIAVSIGILLAVLFFMKRMSESVAVVAHDNSVEQTLKITSVGD